MYSGDAMRCTESRTSLKTNIHRFITHTAHPNTSYGRRTLWIAKSARHKLLKTRRKTCRTFLQFSPVFSLSPSLPMFEKKILFRLFIILWKFELHVFSSRSCVVDGRCNASVGGQTRIDSRSHWTVRNKCNESLARTPIDRIGSCSPQSARKGKRWTILWLFVVLNRFFCPLARCSFCPIIFFTGKKLSERKNWCRWIGSCSCWRRRCGSTLGPMATQ